MKMTLREFHNGLRILINIDRWELEEAGIVKTYGEIARREATWESFKKDPYRFFITASDAQAICLWSIIEKRM